MRQLAPGLFFMFSNVNINSSLAFHECFLWQFLLGVSSNIPFYAFNVLTIVELDIFYEFFLVL